MSTITIQQSGITSIPADAIVNVANSALQEGEDKLQEACDKIEHCETGSTVITPAFGCNAKFIIHAVGPMYQDGKPGEAEELFGAYKKSLELCRENEIHSVVFPLISAGIGYPLYDAWTQAIYLCKNSLNKKYASFLDKFLTSIPDRF